MKKFFTSRQKNYQMIKYLEIEAIHYNAAREFISSMSRFEDFLFHNLKLYIKVQILLYFYLEGNFMQEKNFFRAIVF